MTKMRWQDWATLVAGVWLLISPWVLGFSRETLGMWDMVIVGIVVGLLALWARSTLMSATLRQISNP